MRKYGSADARKANVDGKEGVRTPKQVEKVGVGSAMPSSVPGVLEV